MVYTSNVSHVTGVNSLFQGRTYHHLLEEAAERFKASTLSDSLNDHQLNIAADVALRTVALERWCPEMFVFTPAYWLANCLRVVAKRKELFPAEHDYMQYYELLPSDRRQDFDEMLSLAGQTVYEWERDNGRFPHCREKPDFLLEYMPVSETAQFIYDCSADLPMSPFI